MHVCIVAHKAYGALKGGTHGHIGGIERQTALMAKWLSAHGVETSLIVWDEGGDNVETIDGVRVVKLCPQNAGFPFIRFFHPRWTSLVRALKQVDADVYYQNGAENATGQVALWCQRNRKAFVFSTAANTDVLRELPDLRSARDRILYRRGLRAASEIVAQTAMQADKLRKNFGVSSTVLPMPCEFPVVEQAPQPPPQSSRQRVVWIGRISPVKRLEWLIRIAQDLPEIDFQVIGPFETEDYANKMLSASKDTRNLEFLGAVGREEVSAFYSGALCLCCTSISEGFPNTFLEAWSQGLPVVSSFDADNLLSEKGLGIYGESPQALIAGIKCLSESDSEWKGISRKSVEYYRNHHSLDAAMGRFQRFFLNCSPRSNSPRESEPQSNAIVKS